MVSKLEASVRADPENRLGGVDGRLLKGTWITPMTWLDRNKSFIIFIILN
jgi:hypothetical protein